VGGSVFFVCCSVLQCVAVCCKERERHKKVGGKSKRGEVGTIHVLDTQSNLNKQMLGEP